MEIETMVTLYGIKNCDTVKKARSFLDEYAVAYKFHDFRTDGIDNSLLLSWCQCVSWETLLNKRSTTWRNLDAAVQSSVCNAETASALMAQFPTLIKRPVLVSNDTVLVGFKADIYQKAVRCE